MNLIVETLLWNIKENIYRNGCWGAVRSTITRKNTHEDDDGARYGELQILWGLRTFKSNEIIWWIKFAKHFITLFFIDE